MVSAIQLDGIPVNTEYLLILIPAQLFFDVKYLKCEESFNYIRTYSIKHTFRGKACFKGQY